MIEAAREDGLQVVEKNLSLTEVYTADEMFTTGTMGGLAPVLEVDGRRIGGGSRGLLTLRLQQSHRERAFEWGANGLSGTARVAVDSEARGRLGTPTSGRHSGPEAREGAVSAVRVPEPAGSGLRPTRGYENVYAFLVRARRVGTAVNQQSPEVRVEVAPALDFTRVFVLLTEESGGHRIDHRFDVVLDIPLRGPTVVGMEAELKRDREEVVIPLGSASLILDSARHSRLPILSLSLPVRVTRVGGSDLANDLDADLVDLLF